MEIKVRRTHEAVAERSGNTFIGRSGVYPITIDFVSLEQSDNGAVTFNINCTYSGNKQTIYGSTLFNTDGGENAIGMDLFNKLLVIGGLEDGVSLDTELEEHAVGKDNVVKEFNVIPQLSGIECQIQVKEVFSRYNKEITRNLRIYNFFSEDGATADELVAYETDKSVKKGTQLAKILAKPATTERSYVDNKQTNETAPTAEEVEAYLAAKSGKQAPAPKAVAKPRGNMFTKNK